MRCGLDCKAKPGSVSYTAFISELRPSRHGALYNIRHQHSRRGESVLLERPAHLGPRVGLAGEGGRKRHIVDIVCEVLRGDKLGNVDERVVGRECLDERRAADVQSDLEAGLGVLGRLAARNGGRGAGDRGDGRLRGSCTVAQGLFAGCLLCALALVGLRVRSGRGGG
jgi:hypothetical protein